MRRPTSSDASVRDLLVQENEAPRPDQAANRARPALDLVSPSTEGDERATPGGVSACHGIAVNPTQVGLELGWLHEQPPRGVVVELAETVDREPHAKLVWEMTEPAAFGLPQITSQTWHEDDGSTWFGNTLNLALRIDYARETIRVAAKDGNRQVLVEALASVALPMVAQRHGGLVFHASAACLDDSATMLCAPGGSGKSSLLVGLVAAGWQALSEDQCVLDLDESGRHLIWPGPNWVRFKQGVAPVWPVVKRRFELVDKVAWALTDWMAHAPARLERIVFLEPPGCDAPLMESISTDETIVRLISQTTWLQSQESLNQSVLPQIVNLALSVPGFRLKLPRRTDWLPHGISLLTAG